MLTFSDRPMCRFGGDDWQLGAWDRMLVNDGSSCPLLARARVSGWQWWHMWHVVAGDR
jgi:hypothetical protein